MKTENRITNVKYTALANWMLQSIQAQDKTTIAIDLETLLHNLPKALLHDRDVKCPQYAQMTVCVMHLTDALAQLETPLLLSEYPVDEGFYEIERIPYIISYAPTEMDCLMMPESSVPITKEILETEPEPVKRKR